MVYEPWEHAMACGSDAMVYGVTSPPFTGYKRMMVVNWLQPFPEPAFWLWHDVTMAAGIVTDDHSQLTRLPWPGLARPGQAWPGRTRQLAMVAGHDPSCLRDIVPWPVDRLQNWPWPIDDHHPFVGSKWTGLTVPPSAHNVQQAVLIMDFVPAKVTSPGVNLPKRLVIPQQDVKHSPYASDLVARS